MTTPKIGVIGCGYWGKNLVRNFSNLNSLHSIYDTNKDHANTMAATYNVESIDLATMLESDIDGVVIAAPAHLHYDLAKSALLANKHVFVEKPLSLEAKEAKELCKISKKQNKVLMVGHLLQYHNAFIQLKQLCHQGKLGKLQYIYSNRLNLGKFRNEENILWSFAPHDISMILGLVNDTPESVFATGVCHLNKHIHDVTTTHLTFKNGIQAHIFVSWLHPFKEQKLVVVGDAGMAVFDDALDWSSKLKLYPHQINWLNGIPQPQKADFKTIELTPHEPLKDECQHFLDCIAHGKTPITDGTEGLNVLSVLESAQQSLKSGKTVHKSSTQKTSSEYFIHPSSCIDDGCEIGNGTKIWHYTHVLKGTRIGSNCILGQNIMIGPDVVVGNNCKIQNNVSLYKGVTLEEGVFCGPSCVFTNVHNPRANIERKDEFRPTLVEKGVTIGANATIICGNKLGAYSLIGAGAVITKDVKPHAVMVGNPAKQIGWISHAGEKLDSTLLCPREKRQYIVNDNHELIEIKTQKNDERSAHKTSPETLKDLV
jgi:UDP-2-acetamido-3-amino-2,3-dideoxy-glucuronate N-acetyltransferase